MEAMSDETMTPPQTPADAPRPDEPGEIRPGSRVVVVGGGPGGYEAALVAAQLGAQVAVVEKAGLGGSAVLTDVVPSKTLIATAEVMTLVDGAYELGVRFPGGGDPDPSTGLTVDLGRVNERVRALAGDQGVVARAARDAVVPGPAEEVVGDAAADEGVVRRVAEDVLDVGQRVHRRRRRVGRVVHQAAQFHVPAFGQVVQNVPGADLFALFRRVGDAVAEEQKAPGHRRSHPSPRVSKGPRMFATGRGSRFHTEIMVA